MAAFVRFEDINAWMRGRALVKDVYSLTSRGAFVRDYGLKDQIQRAAVSICSNIAEGFERRGNAEFVKFLWIAKGSAAEVASQLYHAKDLGYISEEEFAARYDDAKAVGGMVYKLIQSIRTSPQGSDFLR